MEDATFVREQLLYIRGFVRIAGVDEVGVGCIAGPVVAAAVIFPVNAEIAGLRDSKTLSPKQRGERTTIIKESAVCWSIGEASPDEITTLGIRPATFLAMRRALTELPTLPDAVLVDGYSIRGIEVYQEAIMKGDSISASIAAASILAKVHRDGLMEQYETTYPGYGFAKHKGYGAPVHMEALNRLGPCPIHRKTFAPVRELLEERV